MMKKIMAFTAVICLCLSMCAFAAPSGWAIPEIESAKRNDLTFDAILSDYQNAITREEFCTLAVLLYKKLSGKDAPAGEVAFSDTTNANINSAYALGIVNGMGDGIFAPTSLVTREEIAAMFTRCIKAALPDTHISDALPNIFPDIASVSDWATDYVKFVNMCEVMTGDQNGNINPKSNTTREQAIAMVLRIYNAFKKTSNPILAFYGFSTSGNTPSNMANGSFAIKALDGKLYIADENGIYDVTSSVLYTSNKAKALYVGSSNIYYINAADNNLYKIALSDKSETKVFDGVVSYSPAGEYIYIKNLQNELVALTIDTGKTTVAAKNVTSVPIGEADRVYYTTSDGIYAYVPKTGETDEIYKISATDTVNSDNNFYFKNTEGFLCVYNTETGVLKTITAVPVKNFCLYSGAIAYTTDDGLYKCDNAGKFNIKMLNDGNVLINSHEKTLFIKSADGKINSLNIYTGEKSTLN